MTHPDVMRLAIAVAFVLTGAGIAVDALVDVPLLLTLTGPLTALLVGARAYLGDGKEGDR